MKSDIYIYTETAFHHEGDLDFMFDLIEMSADCGASAIKFQVLLDYDYLMSKNHPSYDVLLEYTFSKEQWMVIFSKARDLNQEIILMPLDPEACLLINEIDPEYVEIHSICFKDEELLASIKNTDASVIVGVGGRDLSEIDELQNYFGDQLKVLMSGFQSFPTKLEDVKLRRVKEYVQKYPDLIIGYADHSPFDSTYAVKSSEYALIYGARMFEKHITTKEGVKRVDYDSAVGLDKMIELKGNLLALSNDLRLEFEGSLMEIEEPEISYRNRQKMAIAKTDLKAGHILTANDVSFRMTGEKTGFASIQEIAGKTLSGPLKQNDPISVSSFE
jgi:N,N'-diacetyllegionaminate synthase